MLNSEEKALVIKSLENYARELRKLTSSRWCLAKKQDTAKLVKVKELLEKLKS